MTQELEYQVIIEVNDAVADDAASCFLEAGAEAVEIRDQQGLKLPGVELPPIGKTWIITSFRAESKDSLQQELQSFIEDLPYAQEMVIKKIDVAEKTDWATRWKEFFKPLRVGHHLWVVPTWETDFKVQSHMTIVRMDPEMAFGTGAHPTTRLCLMMIEKWMSEQTNTFTPAFLNTRKILDVGTGSGILSIAAALLGPHHVTAIDNDAPSLETAQKNAKQNHVESRIEFIGANLLEKDEPTSQKVMSQSYDLVVANILADPLVEMAPQIYRVLEMNGQLILSGILRSQVERVCLAYVELGLVREREWYEEEWAAVCLRKPATTR